MTNVPKNPKLPLTATSRKAFESRYRELFLREAEKGVSDESLMKAVNDYEAKQNSDSNSQKQEGVQDQAGSVSNEGAKEGSDVTTDDINKEIRFAETRKSASDKYFDLFGSQPIDSMSNDQILNAINVKEEEIAKANEAKEETPTAEVNLQAGQVVATNKTTGESKVFNKQTLKYLKDWEETPIAPAEIRK